MLSPPGLRILAANALVAFGAVSAGIQFLASLYHSFPAYPAVTFGCVLAACLAWGFSRAYPRFSLKHRMARSDITLRVVVGNLFDQETHIVVGFSDTFDTVVCGDRVINRSSVQGQLLHRVYDDDRHALDREISAALSGVSPVCREARVDKPLGKLARYPMGTVAVLGQPARHVFAVAYGRMGNDMVVRAPVEDLWSCFNKLWESIYRNGQLGPVSVPLMGAGLARVNSLDHENLLRVILLSFVAYSRAELVCRELRIIIRPEDVPRVDLIRLHEFLAAF